MLLRAPGYNQYTPSVTADGASNASRRVTIRAVDPPGPEVKCTHGGGVTTYTSSSGWQFTKLPRRQSMTEFMGYDGYTVVIPVMFGDGTDRGGSIEHELETLRGLARNLVGPRNEPAVVRLECATAPLTWLNYVINDMKFNTEHRDGNGARYYAQVDITLFEWQPTSLVLTRSGKSATQLLASASSYTVPPSTPGGTFGGIQTQTGLTPAFNGTGNGDIAPVAGVNFGSETMVSSATYTVRKGDTLLTIAKVTLGAANRWRSIGNLNKDKNGRFINDPKNIYVGQVLRLPFGAKVPTPPFTLYGNRNVYVYPH